MSIERNAAGKIVAKRFTLERIQTAAEEMGGFCIACGEEAERIDPDARKVLCECCGKPFVYGAEEIAIMGLMK